MITFILFISILSILILVHEFGHFITAKKLGVRVEKFSLGFGPELLRKKKNATEYVLSVIPLGGFVKLAGDNLEEYQGQSDEYFAQSVYKRFLIIFFGPLLNYILGFLCFWLIFFVGYPTLTTKVGGLVDGFGAKDAGLEVGDKIIAVEEKKVELWEDLQRIIQLKKAKDVVRLSVLRESKEFTVDVRIEEKQVDDQLGQRRSVALLGITPFDEVIKVRYSFLHSSVLGINKTWDLTVITLKGLWRIVNGKLSIRESVTGPLGIFYITSKAASMGIIVVLHLLATLSVSLGIFNLLPLPVLDGGHILFLAIEKIRGRTLGLKTERLITQLGLTLLVLLVVVVTYNDLLRFFGDRIIKLLNR